MNGQNFILDLDAGAIAKVGKQLDAALEQTADWVIKDVRKAKTIPRQHGVLYGEAIDVVMAATGLVEIVQATPYARRLYYHPEYNFQRTPRTEEVTRHYKRVKRTKIFEDLDETYEIAYEGRKRVATAEEADFSTTRRRRARNQKEKGGYNENAGAFWFKPYLPGGEKYDEVQIQLLRACRRVGLDVSL